MGKQAKKPVGVVGEWARGLWTRHWWVFCRSLPIYLAGAAVLAFLFGGSWVVMLLWGLVMAVSEPYFQHRRDRRRRIGAERD
ncbi:hypothetical protein [Streptomyces sp. NPDC127066]|uniref:hypothetical protein n=1 Tax=Streptomyces sp. NPDC127066 TaxID=3347125 RepID=UPI003649BA96